jgi:hypothetical protein
MTNNSTMSSSLQSEGATAVHLLEDWFDPIEAGLRDYGARSRHQLAGRRRHDRRSRDHAGDPAQSDLDAARRRCAWRPRPAVNGSMINFPPP